MRPAGAFAFVLLSLFAGPGAEALDLRLVARLPYYLNGSSTQGDADHDGRPELYALDSDSRVDYILEHRGNWEFDPSELGWEWARNWDLGDADQDGKSDLVVQASVLGSRYVFVVESPDSASLPDSVVWADSVMAAGSVTFATITDLDGDSLREITGRGWSGLRVCENKGDNRYNLVFEIPNSPDRIVDFAQTHDLDRDGVPELVCGTNRVVVAFWEAVADDSLELKARCELPGVHRAMYVTAAPDMDQDGRPEAIALGVHQDNSGTVGVFESPCDDSFELVWYQQFVASYFGEFTLAVGDVDGDSVPEFALTDGINVRLFRCTGNDQYSQCWILETKNGSKEVGLYDLDCDGRCELLYRDGGETFIMQYVDSLGVCEAESAWSAAVRLPSVVARGQVLELAGFHADAGIEVVDAAGRVVARPRDGVWNPRGVSPGAYFVRVRSGNQAVVQKVLVLR